MKRNRITSLIGSLMLAGIVSVTLSGCLLDNPAGSQPTSQSQIQAQKAQAKANSLVFTDNQEIDNIAKRRTLFSKPGGLMYIVLLNSAGQPIMYETVDGKITSSGKRLLPPDRVERRDVGGNNGGVSYQVRPAPSDEGTYGSSGNYIYWWNTDGAYQQWSGDYFLSDQPVRLRVEPLVVSIPRNAASVVQPKPAPKP